MAGRHVEGYVRSSGAGGETFLFSVGIEFTYEDWAFRANTVISHTEFRLLVIVCDTAMP